MYRKSRRQIILQRKRERCASMRAAKERRRLERAAGEPVRQDRLILELTVRRPDVERDRPVRLQFWAVEGQRRLTVIEDGEPWHRTVG